MVQGRVERGQVRTARVSDLQLRAKQGLPSGLRVCVSSQGVVAAQPVYGGRQLGVRPRVGGAVEGVQVVAVGGEDVATQ